MAAPSRVTKTCNYYVGEIKKQLRHGYGLYVYGNTFFRYEGEWRRGKKHGQGKLFFKDGSYYEGDFMDGEITGNGLRYWASSGNTYSGEFENGELHGHGVMQYKNGGTYEGEFVFGIREGHGLLVDQEGQKYSGAFHKNKKNGDGHLTFKNGDHYEGGWVLDQRQGHGVMHFVDGTIYEGQWRNDVFNGQGTMIHYSGIIYDGLWINGYPAVAAKKIVIVGEDVIDVMQGSPVTFNVQLHNDEGEIAKDETGRALQISAGIKYFPAVKNPSTSILELIEDMEEKTFQTPYGYECIYYPLIDNTSCSQVNIHNEFPSSRTPVLSVDNEFDNRLDPIEGMEEQSKSFDDIPKFMAPEDNESLPALKVRAEAGCAVFQDVVLVSPPERLQHFLTGNETDKNRGKKLSGKISAEKAEKMTVSQDKIEDSRLESIAKDRKLKRELQGTDNGTVRPGEYVIMVEDVTMPPFFGHTLLPAFKLVRVLPEKINGKNNQKGTR
ncbi:MORN repeat-containing protein 1 [Bombina bombina]|uniref:MORN repeat-containing protein 1 n=1 Tax=Bombina bombina TaxID=8345 RepID=UPI00235A62A6|nr:MORN repeat-containing protein 1 [Bombina bombina]